MDTDTELYRCDKCNKEFKFKCRYESHLKTLKHTGDKRKQRVKIEDLVCSYCKEFRTRNEHNLKIHILNYHKNKEEREKEYPYYCNICDFGSFQNSHLEKHKLTKKHKNLEKYK